MKRLVVFVLSIMMLMSCFSFNAFSLNYDKAELLDYGNFETNELQIVSSENIQPRSVIGTIGTVVTVFRCIEYLGKTVRTFDAVADSIAAGDSFGKICNTAIDAFTGRASTIVQPPVSGTEHSQKLYKELTSEIKAVHKKIDGLEQDLQDINKSISDLTNAIKAENNKAYINEFRLNYVELSNDMLDEYNQLMVYLHRNDNHIDNVKLSYDDLYIASYKLNDKLFEYMTGNYRIDGLSIQDVMYEYMNASGELSQTQKYEHCISFTEDLFATYALSQYCLLICRLYQLDYCNYYGISQYVTQNEAPESLPYDTIVSYIQIMNDRHEQIVSETAQYIVNKGNYNMDMLYIATKRSEIYTLKYSEMRNELYKGDRYYYHTSFPEKYKYIFAEETLKFEISDETSALIKNEDEIQILNNGRFVLSMKYRDNEIATYNFTVRDRFLSGGYGTAGAPYLIDSVQDLSIAAHYNPSAHYKLISNISVDGTWSNFCFSNFNGVFDGNGYVISNMTIEDNGANCLGFFGSLNSAIVTNLTLRNFVIKVNAENGDYQEIGILSGRNNGTIYNCAIEASQIKYKNVVTTSYAPYQKVIGGMVGYNTGVVENCQSTNFTFFNNIRYFRDFVGKRYLISIGGLVGDTRGSLKNNLVVNPYISLGQLLFEDTYTNNYPINNYCSLSCGMIVGNKSPNISEAVFTGGSLNCDARAIFYILNSNVSTGMYFPKYYGNNANNLASEALTQYRLLSPSSIDRDVYKSISIVKMPADLKAAYGQPWHISGIQLQLEYINGMTALVPITSVSNFNPYKAGKQTVTLWYRSGNGKSLSTTIDIDVECEHNWSPEQMVIAPKCETVGEARITCTRCGYYETKEIAPLGHNYGEWIAEVPATCEGEGTLGHYHCSACNKNFDAEKNELTTIVIPALGHTESEWIVDETATCTEVGSKHKECTVCEKVLATETIEKLGHDKVQHPAQAETCTEHGWNAYETCKRDGCDYTTYEEIPAKGHTYGEWTQTVAPGCETKGEERRDCVNCDHYETKEVDALGYLQDFIDAVNNLSENASAEVTYSEIYSALQIYAKLTEEEKEEAAESFEILQQAIEDYNNKAEIANNELADATKIAFMPIATSFVFLAALWFLLRKKFMI